MKAILNTIVSVMAVASYVQASIRKSFFQRCDVNLDGVLTLPEFQQCFYFDDRNLPKSEALIQSDIAILFDVVDSNKDGTISSDEYNSLQTQLAKQRAMSKTATATAAQQTYNENGDGISDHTNHYGGNGDYTMNDEIVVKMRDGTVKSMNKQEFFGKYQNMDNKLDGFHRTKSNQLLREYEQTISLENIREKDPVVSKVITIARWSLLYLKHFRLLHESCKMTRMSSIPITKDGKRLSEDDLASLKDVLDYDSLRIDIGNKETFEISSRLFLNCEEVPLVVDVQVEYNKLKYLKPPYLGMISANAIQLLDDNVVVAEEPIKLPSKEIVEITTIDGIPFLEFHSVLESNESVAKISKSTQVSTYLFGIRISVFALTITIISFSIAGVCLFFKTPTA